MSDGLDDLHRPDDGGPAFPMPPIYSPDMEVMVNANVPGMKLIDWFARASNDWLFVRRLCHP